jgi:molybdopterin converting factor small subunit
MSIRIHIHKAHRMFSEGLDAVDVAGNTVGECLEALTERFPDLRRVLFTRSGGLVRNIDVYINHGSAYPDELKQPVSDGDAIHLNLLLMGG